MKVKDYIGIILGIVIIVLGIVFIKQSWYNMIEEVLILGSLWCILIFRRGIVWLLIGVAYGILIIIGSLVNTDGYSIAFTSGRLSLMVICLAIQFIINFRYKNKSIKHILFNKNRFSRLSTRKIIIVSCLCAIGIAGVSQAFVYKFGTSDLSGLVVSDLTINIVGFVATFSLLSLNKVEGFVALSAYSLFRALCYIIFLCQYGFDWLYLYQIVIALYMGYIGIGGLGRLWVREKST